MAHSISSPVHSELVIKKSRFIGCVQPVAGRPAAQAIVAALRLQHPGAAHVCWALLAGGLVRAYTDCVAQAVKQADKVPILRLRALHCAVPYALEGLVRREIAAAGGRLDDIRHGEAVAFDITLAEAAADELVARLGEACQGRIVWEAPE